MKERNIVNGEKSNDIKKVILFVFITYSISWTIWFLTSNILIQIIGSCMPSIIGYIFLQLDKSDTYEHFGRRLIHFRLIKLKWIFIIILVIPLITLISIFTHKLLGGDISYSNAFTQNLRNPMTVFTIIFMGLGAGFGEELGWRGFLLDTFQKYWNGLTSGIFTGVIWASWHIPTYIIDRRSLFSLSFVNYFFFIIILSVLFTTVYNNNNRSILSVILLHAMVNITNGIVFFSKSISISQSIIQTICLLFILITIIFVCKIKAPCTFNMIGAKQ